MKNSTYFTLAVLVFSLFTISTFAQKKQNRETIMKNVEKVENSFADNFAKGNAKAMAEGYTIDAIAFPPNAPEAKGREAIQKVWAGIIAMGKVDFKLHTDGLRVFGTTAVSHGTYDLEVTMKDGKPIKDNGKFLEVWKEQKDGSWLREYDMWNSNLPLPQSMDEK